MYCIALQLHQNLYYGVDTIADGLSSILSFRYPGKLFLQYS